MVRLAAAGPPTRGCADPLAIPVFLEPCGCLPGASVPSGVNPPFFIAVDLVCSQPACVAYTFRFWRQASERTQALAYGEFA